MLAKNWLLCFCSPVHSYKLSEHQNNHLDSSINSSGILVSSSNKLFVRQLDVRVGLQQLSLCPLMNLLFIRRAIHNHCLGSVILLKIWNGAQMEPCSFFLPSLCKMCYILTITHLQNLKGKYTDSQNYPLIKHICTGSGAYIFSQSKEPINSM